MTTTIKSNSDGSSAIQTNGVDRIQIDTSGVPLLVTTPSTGDNSKKIATTEFVSNTALGVGQTWVNATGIRSANTPYVNDTSRPILVTVATQANSTTNSGALNVDGVNTSVQGLGNGLSNSQTSVVPAGSTYRLNTVNQVITLWSELR
mgnify:CR=1 FL=1